MIYWIAGIGLTFGLFIVFVMKMAFDYDDDKIDEHIVCMWRSKLQYAVKLAMRSRAMILNSKPTIRKPFLLKLNDEWGHWTTNSKTNEQITAILDKLHMMLVSCSISAHSS